MGRKKKQDASLDPDITESESDSPAAALVRPTFEHKVIEVRGAQLKDHYFCNYSYDHRVATDTINSVSIKSQVPVHQDMRFCFTGLNPHLAVICDEVAASEIGSITQISAQDPLAETLALFAVRSFKLDDYDLKEGVILTGDKRLSIGGAVSLTTPKIYWHDSNYPFLQELRIAIAECLFEVEEYMNGKQSQLEAEDDRQTTLDFGGSGYQVSVYANPEAMSRVADMDGEDRAGEEPYVETDL